ncbi:calcium-binding protein [Tsuneonella mangrovi]|uniref:calcium-binding protein n=1 Tax=Tsuneonella mangrovi TaxID=1982042 RepID=UPI000BA220DE|nr:calcium-binding protein [Tsuneonella mangrovi]
MATITGTTGNDTLQGTTGNDTIDALDGDDVIVGSPGSDTVDGGGGFDVLLFPLYYQPWFPEPSGGLTISVSGTHVYDSLGIFNTTYSNIEELAIWARDPSYTYSVDITVNASQFVSTLAGYGNVWIKTGSGNDHLIGSQYPDTFDVYLGNDVVTGGDGQDTVVKALNPDGTTAFVTGGTLPNGDSSVQVKQGSATTLSATSIEYLNLGQYDAQFDQTVDASGSPIHVGLLDGAGNDTFIGSVFNDLFSSSSGSGGTDTYTGGGGPDTFSWDGTADAIDGTTITDFDRGDTISLENNTTGSYLVTTFIGRATFSDTAGEYRYVKSGDQTILQFDFNGDSLSDASLLLASRWLELSNPYNQHIVVAPATQINGTTASETINGTSWDDIIHGNGGDDIIYGLGGYDTIDVGTGNDTVRAGPGNDSVTGSGGDDFISGGGGDDTLDGGPNNDHVYGNAGVDYVNGGGGDDHVYGGSGNDRVYGSSGNDIVNGQAGDDLVVGGQGIDILVGGLGSDQFLFNTADVGTSTASADRIQDFNQSQHDLIDFHLLDADTTTAGNQAFDWIGSSAFSGHAGELHYEIVGNTTYVSGDTNGDGGADFYLLLTGQIHLDAGDFVL